MEATGISTKPPKCHLQAELSLHSFSLGGLAVVFIDYTHKGAGKTSARCVGLLRLSRDLGAVSALL